MCISSLLHCDIWWARVGSHHCLRFFRPVNNNYLFDRPIHSLHHLQQAAITKPSSNCQRSIYPENSNGHLDFHPRQPLLRSSVVSYFSLSTQSNCQQIPFIHCFTRQSRSCCKCVLIMLYILPSLGIFVNHYPTLYSS